MSSGELLDLLDGLPESSGFKGALRGFRYGLDYEWSAQEYREAAIARQLAPLNSEGEMAVSRMLYESYFSPVERAMIEAQQQRDADLKNQAKAHIRKSMVRK